MRQFWQVPFGSQGVNYTDGPQLDPFHRVRGSNPETLFDQQFTYGQNTASWAVETSGTGAVSDLLVEGAVQLSTGGTASGAKATYQTNQYMRIQPGKGQLVLLGFNFVASGVANLRLRIGYFDSNNGIFLERTSSGLRLVKRSDTTGSVVDTQAEQSAWNLDKLDGTGASGVTLDTTKGNIIVIDSQWLGRQRVGFDFGSGTTYAHQFTGANQNSIAGIGTINLPLRVEIENTGVTSGTNTLKLYAASVISEGGSDLGGRWQLGSAKNSTGVTVTTRVPILSIRPKSTFNTKTFRGYVDLLSGTVLATGGGDMLIEGVINGTLTGASFSDVLTGVSAVEFDTAATAISGGLTAYSTFVSGNTAVKDALFSGIPARNPIVRSADNSTGETITVVATKLGGATTTVYASLNWREQR